MDHTSVRRGKCPMVTGAMILMENLLREREYRDLIRPSGVSGNYQVEAGRLHSFLVSGM